MQEKTNTWPVLAGLVLAAGFSLWVLLDTLHIPLLDQHGFRQTQTAITAFWMTKNFSLLNYETPVLGMPWAIPFEFPLYQALVALLWKLFPSLSMDAAARLVSFAAWWACAYPIHRIMMRYFHDVVASGILLCLFFGSPFSLFWARTAMIETTVLLCSLMFLWQLIRLGDAPTWRTAMLASVYGVLAILVKVTTVPPFMLAGGLHILTVRRQTVFSVWKPVALPFILSMAALMLWTHHADAVKGENSVGNFLTSTSLSWWNFGTLAQKFNFLATSNLLQRNIHELYGSMAAFVASFLCILLCDKRFLLSSLYALLLFMVPILLFTNLYIVHTYYQTANMVFVLACTAIMLYGASKRLPKTLAFLPVLGLTIAFVLSFKSMYAPNLHYAVTSAPQLVVGQALTMLTNLDDRVVVFGDDWNSATQYYAQRRGFSYPWWVAASRFSEILDSLPQRIGGKPAAVAVYDRPENTFVVNALGEEMTGYVWTAPWHLSKLEHTGKVFPPLLASMRKARVADAILYYQDRPENAVSLLDKTISGVSPHTTVQYEKNTLQVKTEHGATFFSVPVTLHAGKRYFVRLRVQGLKNRMQLFYYTTAGGDCSETNSISQWVDEELEMLILLPSDACGPNLRLDLTNQSGKYTISEFSLLEIEKR